MKKKYMTNEVPVEKYVKFVKGSAYYLAIVWVTSCVIRYTNILQPFVTVQKSVTDFSNTTGWNKWPDNPKGIQLNEKYSSFTIVWKLTYV